MIYNDCMSGGISSKWYSRESVADIVLTAESHFYSDPYFIRKNLDIGHFLLRVSFIFPLTSV